MIQQLRNKRDSTTYMIEADGIFAAHVEARRRSGGYSGISAYHDMDRRVQDGCELKSTTCSIKKEESKLSEDDDDVIRFHHAAVEIWAVAVSDVQ